MMMATVALAYYAYVTAKEGKKGRETNSIEKQLEKVYTPMCEILSHAKSHTQTNNQGQEIRYAMIFGSDHEKLLDILENYGHYLEREVRPRVRELLANCSCTQSARDAGYVLYSDTEYKECRRSIAERREKLLTTLTAPAEAI